MPSANDTELLNAPIPRAFYHDEICPVMDESTPVRMLAHTDATFTDDNEAVGTNSTETCTDNTTST
jgi:hypothetical protein